MIRVKGKIEVGMRFYLPEEAHKLIFENADEVFSIREFCVEEVCKIGKTSYVICKSCETINNIFIRFAITKNVANYIFGKEEEDCNEGYTFNEYIPKLGSEIMVTNSRNLFDVTPGKLKLGLGLIEMNGISLRYLFFEFEYIIGKCHTNLNYFFQRNSRYTWKFIDFPDETSMTDYEKVFSDTLIHKKYFIKSAKILADFLRKEGAWKHAEQLEARALVHDNSKITCIEELDFLSRIIEDKSNLKDTNKQLNSLKKKSIKLHWEHNSHHPEHYESVLDMERLDIMEMCCDWHARAQQFGTELMSFVMIQNQKRFHFPEWMFAEILHYCNVLVKNENNM